MPESFGAFPIDVIPEQSRDPFDAAELHHMNELAHQDRFDYVDRLLSYVGMEEQLATPESRVEFVDRMTGEQFVQTLEWLNGVIMNRPTTQRHIGTDIHVSLGINDGQGESIIEEVFPAPEDRTTLLHQTLAAAQSVASLEDKACILAFGIAGIHAFLDGNGRLARVVYYLLTEGYRPNDQTLRDILSLKGRELIDTEPHDVDTLVLQGIQLASRTHRKTADGQVLPRIRTVVTKDVYAHNPEHLRLHGRSIVRDLDRFIFDLLTIGEYARMLPYAAGKTEKNLSTLRAMMTMGDEIYFALDRFWRRASREDIALYYQLYRDMANMRLGLLLEELQRGDESRTVVVFGSDGKPAREIPASELLKNTIRRKNRVEPNRV